jgi:peptidoglycan/LPS O-acetylase OafA/YrhL
MVLTTSPRSGTDASPAAASPVATRHAARFEPHIQGLRALAVAVVVLYHLWPSRVPGGFVGVDAFFVISGYLICGHLLREIDLTGTIRLLDFWARRIRRLIPAALTVLVVAGAFVVVAMPGVDWQQNLEEIRAAALYVENWQLVADSVDYLASQNAPSIVQHFWSLSVEEQFYILQPIVLLLAVKLVRSRRAVVPLLVVTLVVSLAYSVVLTASDPGVAYFSTASRAWEFAVGGLAAVVGARLQLSERGRGVLGWLGLALIAAALLGYSSATPFPGVAAVVPVAGTALAVLFAGSTARFSPSRLLGAGPVRAVGDWSYSIYLWHWPLLIAAPVVLGHPVGWKVKVAIVLATLTLAVLTKRYVEDRFRRGRTSARPRSAYLTMAAAAGVVALTATAGVHWQEARTAADVGRAASALASSSERCLGINAVVNDCAKPFEVTRTVVPAAAADDVPWNVGVAASQQCPGESTTSDPVPHACTFNDPVHPKKVVALVGDSHADHLVDALDIYAKKHDWRLVTFTREGCSGIPSQRIKDDRCRTWSSAVHAAVLARKDIDAVVYSNYSSAADWTAEDEVATWRAVLAAGHQVVPVVDVPGMPAGVNGPKCVAQHMTQYDPCTNAPPQQGKTALAAARLGIPAIDLDDLLCQGGRCHSVIGGQVVYMDEAHLTYHFSMTLWNVLGSRIESAITTPTGAGSSAPTTSVTSAVDGNETSGS